MKTTNTDAPLTLGDIAEPRPSDGGLKFRIRRALRIAGHSLLPHNITRTAIIGGIRYRLKYREMSGLIRKGSMERHQIVFFFNEARRRGARVFFDIGANVGYYSLLAARLGIFDEIHAFEPHPVVYQKMLRLIKDNNFEGAITPHNIAVSDADGELRMQADGMQIIDSPAGEFHPMRTRAYESSRAAHHGSVTIKAARLDSLFALRGKNICAKIDVEGHEEEALGGMRELLAHNNAFLQIEIWPVNTKRVTDIASRGFALTYHIDDDFYFVKESE